MDTSHDHVLRSARIYLEHRIDCPARDYSVHESDCECGVIAVLVAINIILGLPVEHRPNQLARTIWAHRPDRDDPRRHTRGT